MSAYMQITVLACIDCGTGLTAQGSQYLAILVLKIYLLFTQCKRLWFLVNVRQHMDNDKRTVPSLHTKKNG
jgi:hypothetical protein